MSNGTAPIEPAPVPPSIAGIPQPVFESGSATSPATPIPITGSPIIPPPTIGDPVGFPVFPPTTGTAPVPVPVGPLVGPAVAPAPVPPSLPGVPQPQYQTGSGTVPTAASLFPAFTTGAPSPPIVVPNIFQIGNVPPPLPSTVGVAPVQPSPVPTIPQIPWPPVPPTPPPVNTARPVVTIATNLEVGSSLSSNTGTWTNATTYAYEWERNGSPIAGATTATYVLQAADVGAMIACNVTATGAGGEASMDSLSVGPIVEPPPPPEEDPGPDDETSTFDARPTLAKTPASRARRKR
jgi:hypothetical protein